MWLKAYCKTWVLVINQLMLIINKKMLYCKEHEVVDQYPICGETNFVLR